MIIDGRRIGVFHESGMVCIVEVVADRSEFLESKGYRMKREFKQLNRVHWLFTFFWRRCWRCGDEFRFEPIWYGITGPYCGGIGQEKFICSRCAPTRERANTIFEELENLPSLRRQMGTETIPNPEKDNDS